MHPRRLLSLVIGCAGCAAAAPPPADVANSAPSLNSVVISRMVQEARRKPEYAPASTLLVDPRPTRRDGAMRALTGDQTFAASADDEATQRLAELTALGFQSVDVRTLPPCAGSQVIDRDGSAFRTCPRESQVILLTSGTRDAEIGRADSATVSALIIFRDPGGSVSYEFTLDAHRTNGRWLITRVKPGLIVE